MFYNVRVFNPNGEIQRVVPRQELSRIFWEKFFSDEKERKFTATGENDIPRRLKKRLMQVFPELYETS